MTDRPWVVALLAPAPLYVALRYFVEFPGYSAMVPAGFLVTVAFGLATGFGLVRSPPIAWAGRLALLFEVAIAILPTFPAGAIGLDFAAGVMLGLPFVGLEGVWRSEYSPGSRLGTLELTLFLGVLYLAAVPVVAAAGGPLTGLTFFRAVSQVIDAQGVGLLGAFSGSASNASLPLATSLDPVFVALGGLALLGLVLVSLAPRTALGEPLPWAWGRRIRASTGGLRGVDPEELRPGQRDALASRTRAAPPEEMVPPGIESLMIAALAVVVLVVAAVFFPRYVLTFLAVGTIALLLGTIGVLARHLAPTERPPSGEAPVPVADVPSADRA